MRVINTPSEAEEALETVNRAATAPTPLRGKKTTTVAGSAATQEAEEAEEIAEAALADGEDDLSVYTPKYPSISDERDATINAAMAQLQQLLNAPLEEGLTKWRKGYGRDENGNPKMLEYLEWHTVTRQLNRIFGSSNWMWEVKDIKTYGEDSTTGVPKAVGATATITITWPNNEVTSYTNNGMEVVKGSTWEAFEMAFKGAAHDAFKRAATALGEQFGLALYVKEEEAKQVKTSAPVEGSVASAQAVQATTSSQPAAARRSPPPRQSNYQPSVSPEDYDPDTDTVEHCQQCGGDIRGYYSSRLKRVYTTADLVEISKRKTGGQVLCYDCQQGQR